MRTTWHLSCVQMDSGMSEADEDGVDFSRLKRFKKVWWWKQQGRV